MRVEAELNKYGDRIEVRFPSDREDWLEAIDGVTGRRKHRYGTYWSVPVEWSVARELRAAFGEALHLGPELRAWGHREKARVESLQELSGQSSPLSYNEEAWDRIGRTAPELAMAMYLGPRAAQMTPEERADAIASGEYEPSFQHQDIMFMVGSDAPLNANHMGLGKTPETIAAIVGSGLDDGPVLVVAPVTAAEGTWPAELATWLPDAVTYVARGSRKDRQDAYEESQMLEGSWLIINPAQLMIKRDVRPCGQHGDLKKSLTPVAVRQLKECPGCHYSEHPANPELFDIEFSAVVFDEAHEHGILGGFKTQTGLGTERIRVRKGGKKILLSGTPLGGRPEKLFNILQFLHPDIFTSRWRFARQYLEIETKTIGYRNVQTFSKIGGIKRCESHQARNIRPVPGECAECDWLEKLLFDAMAPYMLRRTKADVLKELPPKMYNEIWVDFSSDKHRKQYTDFSNDAMVEEEGDALVATNTLSEYLRLTQMSFGKWDIKTMTPTEDSPKLQALVQKLTEIGIFDKDQTSQAVIFSQFKTVVNVVAKHLEEAGAAVGVISGDVKGTERAALKREFQGEGGVRVLVVCTTAGGTSLTLDRASDVFFLDRMWNPDRDEQAEDRCHRASRIHQVTVHRIMTKGTIDDYRNSVADKKMDTNQRVLDLRRYINGS